MNDHDAALAAMARAEARRVQSQRAQREAALRAAPPPRPTLLERAIEREAKALEEQAGRLRQLLSDMRLAELLEARLDGQLDEDELVARSKHPDDSWRNQAAGRQEPYRGY